MLLQLLFFSSLACIASAAAIGPWHHEPWGQPYRDYVGGIKRVLAATSTITCLTPANSAMPSSTLPPPSQGLAVYHVALGRGMQVCVGNLISPLALLNHTRRTTLALLVLALRLLQLPLAPSPISTTPPAWPAFPYRAETLPTA